MLEEVDVETVAMSGTKENVMYKACRGRKTERQDPKDEVFFSIIFRSAWSVYFACSLVAALTQGAGTMVHKVPATSGHTSTSTHDAMSLITDRLSKLIRKSLQV